MASMCYSKLAMRLGIDNTPPTDILANLARTVAVMGEIRALLGYPLHLVSGYRCEELEKLHNEVDYQVWCLRQVIAVDDASWQLYFSEKAHPKGFAADFTCTQFGFPKRVAGAIAASSIAFDQCIAEIGWVHVSFDPRLRREVLYR